MQKDKDDDKYVSWRAGQHSTVRQTWPWESSVCSQEVNVVESRGLFKVQAGNRRPGPLRDGEDKDKDKAEEELSGV